MKMRNCKKRMFHILLACALTLSLVGCGGGGSGESGQASGQTGNNSASGASSSTSGSAATSDYSDVFKSSIEIICPWAAGGGADSNARQIGAVVGEMTGQTVTVSNQTGGSGAVGFSAIINANPDGNTIGIITAELNTLPPQGLVTFTYENMYPLIRLCTLPSVVAVPADSPFNTLEDLVEYAKANPGKLKVGTVGTGSIWHICAAKLMSTAGIELTTVPYDGASSAATAMLAGEIDMTTTELSVAHAYVQSGDMKILGIMTEERLEDYPDYPTCAEQGYDCVGGSFQGMFCPNDVDDETKAAWEAILTEAYESEAYQTFCKNSGMIPAYLNHADWEAFLAEDLSTVDALMKDLGLAK